jgi:hypothetical protein
MGFEGGEFGYIGVPNSSRASPLRFRLPIDCLTFFSDSARNYLEDHDSR